MLSRQAMPWTSRPTPEEGGSWGWGMPMEEGGDELPIQTVELEDRMAEIWEKIGGESLERWVAKVKSDMDNRENDEKERLQDTEAEEGWAWDDVNGGEILLSDLRKARKEEIDFMVARRIWSEAAVAECWET